MFRKVTEKKSGYEKWALRAGPKLRDKAKDRGLNVLDEVLAVEVKDQKGPLADNGIEQTKRFAQEFLQAIKNERPVVCLRRISRLLVQAVALCPHRRVHNDFPKIEIYTALINLIWPK
jgi:hypothetical protein